MSIMNFDWSGMKCRISMSLKPFLKWLPCLRRTCRYMSSNSEMIFDHTLQLMGTLVATTYGFSSRKYAYGWCV